MIKPPGFDPAKKYPLKLLIHGGPQGAWEIRVVSLERGSCSPANGYVVVMIQFSRLDRYGQKFTDSISGDWAGSRMSI